VKFGNQRTWIDGQRIYKRALLYQPSNPRHSPSLTTRTCLWRIYKHVIVFYTTTKLPLIVDQFNFVAVTIVDQTTVDYHTEHTLCFGIARPLKLQFACESCFQNSLCGKPFGQLWRKKLEHPPDYRSKPRIGRLALELAEFVSAELAC
jgi:hypothetical protein